MINKLARYAWKYGSVIAATARRIKSRDTHTVRSRMTFRMQILLSTVEYECA